MSRVTPVLKTKGVSRARTVLLASYLLGALLLVTCVTAQAPSPSHEETIQREAQTETWSLVNRPNVTVIPISNLEGSGPGSLRECAEGFGPRVCIFEVGGVIQLDKPIVVRNPHLLVAGQTAPPPGITITSSGFKLESHHISIEHIAVRPGDGRRGSKPGERDGISIGAPPPSSAHHISLKNLSLTWAIDENLSLWYPTTHHVTVSHSLIAEGLYNSIHPKGPHSKGILIGPLARNVVLRENVIAFNEERNPYIEPGAQVELANNIVYGWGPRGPWSICNLTNNDRSKVPVTVSLVGNLFLPGPHSFLGSAPVYAKNIAARSRIFVRDNRGPHRAHERGDDWDITDVSMEQTRTEICPFASGCSARWSSAELEDRLLPHVGSRPAERSEVDQRILAEIQERRGDLKDCTIGCERATGRLRRPHSTYRRLTPPTGKIAAWLDGFTQSIE